MKFNTMAKTGIMSHLSKGAHRAASTLGSGRAQLLQKEHDDIKGQPELKDVPVDQLLYSLFKVRLWYGYVLHLFIRSLAYISCGRTVKERAIHPRLYMSLVLLRWRLESPTASQSLPSIGFAPPRASLNIFTQCLSEIVD
ncbi:hypothetical protein BGY98DRAFT_965541 [Russula aff. rugulosa BPL654]|nr:hypothetical protein BGY98DRAFT_965541 [Russula aff. rugulosa BPL654]